MNIKGLSIKGLTMSTLDSDALAFITAGNITNSVEINAVGSLVTQMKNAGIWARMVAVYPFVGGTALAHKFNLLDPQDTNAAHRIVFSGGWTHTDKGALANGTNAWGDPNVFFGSDSATWRYDISVGAFSTQLTPIDPSALRIDLGIDGTYMVLSNNCATGGKGAVRLWDPYSATIIDKQTTRGLVQGSRSSNTGQDRRSTNTQRFVNVASNAFPSADADKNYPVLAAVHNEASHPGVTAYQKGDYGFAYIGHSLTPTQQSVYEGIIEAFNSDLGR
jgi:hypothetical protein